MTTITLTDAAIGTGLGAAVRPLTLRVGPGAPTAVAIEGDERPLLVSMLLGGRLKPDSGEVTVDGDPSLDSLRLRTALVDTPMVAEPTPGASLAVAVAEEFSFSSQSTSRRAVKRSLDEHGLAEYAGLPLRALPSADRVRLFSELALLRPGVSALIVTSPERHGGSPAEWYDGLAAIAERGVTIAVVTDAATSDLLISLGARDAYFVAPEPALADELTGGIETSDLDTSDLDATHLDPTDELGTPELDAPGPDTDPTAKTDNTDKLTR